MKVIIVIPVYKPILNIFERTSLEQLSRILPEYEKCFIKPRNIKLEFLNEFPFKTLDFDDSYFTSTESYSRLLLNSVFYMNFIDYDYLLIYQTDAFVFKDNLMTFCSMGYDYIGAPEIPTDRWIICGSCVGNGGLSLRKVSSALHVLNRYGQYLNNPQLKDDFMRYEDLFWAYCGGNQKIPFTTPSIKVASKFSTEHDVNHMISEYPKRGLPFGTHAWYRINYDFWKSRIEEFGYKLPSCEQVEFITTYNDSKFYNIEQYMLRRIDQYNKGKTIKSQYCVEDLKKWFAQYFKMTDTIYIWGAGLRSRYCIEYFKKFGIKIEAVIDKKCNYGVYCGEKAIESVINDPTQYRTYPVGDKRIYTREHKIVVNPAKYGNEISEYLSSRGLTKNRDYYLFDDIRKITCDKYVRILRNAGNENKNLGGNEQQFNFS